MCRVFIAVRRSGRQPLLVQGVEREQERMALSFSNKSGTASVYTALVSYTETGAFCILLQFSKVLKCLIGDCFGDYEHHLRALFI